MDDEPTDSDVNEYMARKVIQDLLEEHKGRRLIVEAKLSLWLEQEVTAYNNKEPADEQPRPPHRKTPRRVWFGEE